MNSGDWSKKYEVLSMSRLSLRSLGFSNEGISSLTDEDMERMAQKLHNDYFIGFEEDVRFIVACQIIEKVSIGETDGRTDQTP